MKENAKQSKREQVAAITDPATREKISMLEDYCIDIRQEIALLKLENSIYEIENVACYPDAEVDFYRECIEEMEKIIRLDNEINEAKDVLASTYKIDEQIANEEA